MLEAGVEFPLRSPTAFLFFAASRFALYHGPSQPDLRWMALAAFVFFFALGPVRWIEITLYTMRNFVPRNDNESPGDTKGAILIEKSAGYTQIVLFAVGTVIGFVALWAGLDLFGGS